MLSTELQNRCGDCRWMDKELTRDLSTGSAELKGRCRLFRIPTTEDSTPQQRAQEVSQSSILVPNLTLMRRGLCFEKQLPEEPEKPEEKITPSKVSTSYF